MKKLKLLVKQYKIQQRSMNMEKRYRDQLPSYGNPYNILTNQAAQGNDRSV